MKQLLLLLLIVPVLARDANGTPETLTLAVAYTATNADLLYKFGWQELTN